MDLAGRIKKGFRVDGSSLSDNFKEIWLDDSTSVSFGEKKEEKFVVEHYRLTFSSRELDFQIWIAIGVALVSTVILLSIYLWRKNKIRSKFSYQSRMTN